MDSPLSAPRQAPPTSPQVTLQSSNSVAPVTPTDNTSETVITNDDAGADKPAVKTNTSIEQTTKVYIPEKRITQKQTALTKFYKLSPLHIIETSLDAHKSRFHNKKLPSTKRISSSKSTSSTMASTPPPAKRRATLNVGLLMPLPEDFQLMAEVAGITVPQMKEAHILSLQTLGFTITHPNVTPPTVQTPNNTVNVEDSPISNPTGRISNAGGGGYNSPPQHSFGTAFVPGKNQWVTDTATHALLGDRHNFRTTPGAAPLELTQSINRMQYLFSLAVEITGTIVTPEELEDICIEPMLSSADPTSRFANADLPTLSAVDGGFYHKGNLTLRDVLSGRHGILYSKQDKCPPHNCVMVLQLKGVAPNTGDATEHVIFLPDLLLLITVNNHRDMKDTAGGNRVRNAWQLRKDFFTAITSGDEASRVKACNARIAGRIFGGGDHAFAKLARISILSAQPNNRKTA